MTTRPPGRPKGTGDEHPSYQAVHYRVWREYGPAKDHLCIGCFKPATQWAYIGDETDPGRMTETTVRRSNDRPVKVVVQVYSTNVDMYRPMCDRCHNEMDRQVDCGHDPDRVKRVDRVVTRRNGRTYTQSQRRCLDCQAEASKAWRDERRQFEHDQRQAAKLRKEASL